jgi:hypothetical protein
MHWKWITLTLMPCFLLLEAFNGIEFSADLIQKSDSMTIQSKYFQKGRKIRTETKTEDGKVVATVIDLEAKRMFQIVPEEKAYMEVPLSGEFASWAADEKTQQELYERKLIGTETVNGYLCDKYALTPKKNGLEPLTTWIGKKLGVQLKAVGKSYSMEYTNIKEGGLLDSLFSVPPGFKKTSTEDLLGGE